MRIFCSFFMACLLVGCQTAEPKTAQWNDLDYAYIHCPINANPPSDECKAKSADHYEEISRGRGRSR